MNTKHNDLCQSFWQIGFVIATLLLPTLSESVYASKAETIESGVLLLQSEHQEVHQKVLSEHTDVEIDVSGLISRVFVSQHFTNESEFFAEGVYVFPLPEDSAVDELIMTIGERIVVGEIKEKKAAREAYETAKAAGQNTALVEQQRPNIFTTSVANIPPGATVKVEIAYTSELRYDQGEFSLAFPLTMTPRYIPGREKVAWSDEVGEVVTHTSGWGSVENAKSITPPVVKADQGPTANIIIRLDTALALDQVDSTSHRIVVDKSSSPWVVRLANGAVASDRDFHLRWNLMADSAPMAGVFKQVVDGETYAFMMLMPPQNLSTDHPVPRDVRFVIDTSGSMSGQSMSQAKKALVLALQRLHPVDTFNIIAFDDYPQVFSNSSQLVTAQNIADAIDWVNALEADGGTEMHAALKLALQPNDGEQPNDKERPNEEERIVQLIFMTDGSVGNEDQLFEMISKHIGKSRLFTVAIGSAPNRYFMRNSARIGRGTSVEINHASMVVEQMEVLFNKIETPVLTDIELEFVGVDQPEFFPNVIPDMYAGEPVVITAKWDEIVDKGQWLLKGQHQGTAWQRDVSLDASVAQSHINQYWASEKIEHIRDQRLFNVSEESIKAQVLPLALAHKLITPYTSLVAVDQQVVRDPQQDHLHSESIANAIPHGTTVAFPSTGLDLNFQWLLALSSGFLALLLRMYPVVIRQVKACV